MSEESGYINGVQTATYRIWAGMKNRCLNPGNKDYGRYGGRGITVCDRWLTFSNFLADMGVRPKNLTIDRIDNEKGYAPDNCQWASRKVQRRNTSDVRRVVLDGEAVSLSDACEVLGVSHQTARMRLHRGWTVSQALETERATARG